MHACSSTLMSNEEQSGEKVKRRRGQYIPPYEGCRVMIDEIGVLSYTKLTIRQAAAVLLMSSSVELEYLYETTG